jgi:hypothetical protein
MKAPC